MKCSDCSAIVRPVVALDLDGTLGDYHAHFHGFAEHYLGRSLPSPYDGRSEMHDFYGLDLAEYREIKLAFRQGGMKRTMPVFEGAQDLVYTIRGCGGEVWIATTRPWMRLDNIDPDTREWLRRSGIEYDYLLYGEDKYADLCERVGRERIAAVLDDLPEQVMKAMRLELPAILRERPHNRWYSSWGGVSVARTLSEATEIIVDRLTEWSEKHA